MIEFDRYCGGDQLWVCGSHCRVRQKPDKDKPRDIPKPDKVPIAPEPMSVREHRPEGKRRRARRSRAKPCRSKGKEACAGTLRKISFSAHFVHLPSKENGLDIEGMAHVIDDKVFLGLRGPLIDSIAVVMQVPIKDGLRIGADEPKIHFLDLGGLGVGDLAHFGSDLLVLAGPVSSAVGPFRIYRWSPRETDAVQALDEPILDDRTNDSEHPEGICRLEYRGAEGILILYDSPDHRRRIRANRYIADWFRLPD